MGNSGIYIHIPFCRHKCNYCDFYLITNLNIIDRFLDNLEKEICLYPKEFRKEKFDSIFIGGGTPSILTGKQIKRILDLIKEKYEIASESEITLEANPEDFLNNKEKLANFRNAGINRMSFGVQSFNNDELKFLSREHTAEQAFKVIEGAKKYFNNISIDLIYSLPEQDIKKLEHTLETALRLELQHISAYTLIYEKETPIYNMMNRKKIKMNDDGIESELYLLFSDILKNNGYEQYEVSNYAMNGFESRHNLKYWEYDNYIGFGPSAHSMMNGKRWNNFRNIIKYNIALQNDNLPIENENELTKEEMETEFIMIGLRSKGVKLERYKEIFCEDFKRKYYNELKEIEKSGLGFENDKYFRLNEKGYLMLDEICARYF